MPAAVRAAGIAAADGKKWDRALVLAEDTARQVPRTLLLPAGWFQPNRVIDLDAGVTETVRLRSMKETTKVLVVDTKLGEAAQLQQALQSDGHDAVLASTAVDGFFWLRASMPDAVLLNAEQAYQQARQAQAQARASRFADAAALFQALGGGWDGMTPEPPPLGRLSDPI